MLLQPGQSGHCNEFTQNGLKEQELALSYPLAIPEGLFLLSLYPSLPAPSPISIPPEKYPSYPFPCSGWNPNRGREAERSIQQIFEGTDAFGGFGARTLELGPRQHGKSRPGVVCVAGQVISKKRLVRPPREPGDLISWVSGCRARQALGWAVLG